MNSDHASAPPAAYRPGLHRFACVLAGATLLLICAGGHVKSHEAGLSVPDWPTTYGHNMFTFPVSRWTGGVLWEHSHRLIASGVGLLTIVLAVWLFMTERRRWLRWMGAIALLAVCVQGVLGGLTVIYQLPTPISVAHGCLAQSFFCLVVTIAFFTSRLGVSNVQTIAQGGGLDARRLSVACIFVIFAQLVLGAVMRHTQSGLAVPDFPLAYERWAPPLDAASVASYNELRVSEYGLPPVGRGQIISHLLHRFGAVAVLAVVGVTCVWVLLRHGSFPPLATPAIWLVSLTVLQGVLGAAVVLSGRKPEVATLHVAVGAAVLGLSVLLALRAWKLLSAPQRPVVESKPARAVVA